MSKTQNISWSRIISHNNISNLDILNHLDLSIKHQNGSIYPVTLADPRASRD